MIFVFISYLPVVLCNNLIILWREIIVRTKWMPAGRKSAIGIFKLRLHIYYNVNWTLHPWKLFLFKHCGWYKEDQAKASILITTEFDSRVEVRIDSSYLNDGFKQVTHYEAKIDRCQIVTRLLLFIMNINVFNFW